MDIMAVLLDFSSEFGNISTPFLNDARLPVFVWVELKLWKALFRRTKPSTHERQSLMADFCALFKKSASMPSRAFFRLVSCCCSPP